MAATPKDKGKADIGVTGLAVMGSNLARNFAHKGFVTAVHNRTKAKTDALIAEHGAEGAFIPSSSTADFVASLVRPRKIIIMVKAGEATDAVIDEIAALLEDGDILIDGGNAKFSDTIRREAALRDKDIHFVGCGISGGEEGALNGPSIMPGGSKQSYSSLGPILEKISAHVDGEPCCTQSAPTAPGISSRWCTTASSTPTCNSSPRPTTCSGAPGGLEPAEIAAVFEDWNSGELDSFLIEITAQVLGHVDAATGKPFVDVVSTRPG